MGLCETCIFTFSGASDFIFACLGNMFALWWWRAGCICSFFSNSLNEFMMTSRVGCEPRVRGKWERDAYPTTIQLGLN